MIFAVRQIGVPWEQASVTHWGLGWKDHRRDFACWSYIWWRSSCQVCVAASMKLKKQVTVCGAAIFCVAVFSLYLMLDRVQHDPARHQNGGNFPRVSQAWLLTPSYTSRLRSGYHPNWRAMSAQGRNIPSQQANFLETQS